MEANDYYPFGQVMPSRTYALTGAKKTRFGYNGKEKDAEVGSDDYDFGARMYDARICRWMSTDPLGKTQPSWSSYKAMMDNPLVFCDPDGSTEYKVTITVDEKSGETLIEIQTENKIMTDGIKHMVWSGSACYHFENYYYDFATVTTTVIHKDGTQTTTQTQEVIKENGVKSSEGVYFGGDDPGTTKRENWVTDNPDHGQSLAFGIGMDGEGDKPVAQDYSKNAVGRITFGKLALILKRSSLASGYKPGAGSWKSLDPKKVKDWLEHAKRAKELGQKIGDGVVKMQELVNENKDTTLKVRKRAFDNSDVSYTTKDSTMPKKDAKTFYQKNPTLKP